MKKSFDGSSIGTSLILVVFIIICLLTFATLSMLSAKADNTLSLSASEHIAAFYGAEAEAQKKLKEIDDILLSAYQNAENEQDYYDTIYTKFSAESDIKISNDNGIFITFLTDISEIEIMKSQIKVMFPTNMGQALYEVQSWQLVNISNWENNTDFELWSGT